MKVLHPDGWCLVVPDPDEALTNVWAEGASEAGARERARDYARAVRRCCGRERAFSGRDAQIGLARLAEDRYGLRP